MHATVSSPTFSSSSVKYWWYLSEVSENQLKLTQNRPAYVSEHLGPEMKVSSDDFHLRPIQQYCWGSFHWPQALDDSVLHLCIWAMFFASYFLFSSHSQMMSSHFKTLMTAGPEMKWCINWERCWAATEEVRHFTDTGVKVLLLIQ